MAYSSRDGRKPMERASKIAHAQVINDPSVRALLARCRVPRPPGDATELSLLEVPEIPAACTISTVIAVDGGSTEASIREEFPSASVTFFNFGPLLLSLNDLRALDVQEFIFPEDLRKLKKIERFTLAMPTRNVALEGQPGLVASFRRTLHEFVEQPRASDSPLGDTLRWLLFRGWSDGMPLPWRLPHCPNACEGPPIDLEPDTPPQSSCPNCGGPVYTIDALRLHERVDEEQGAGGVTSYLLTTLEQLVMAHVVRNVLALKKSLVSELLFVKDGPLAFFGVVAPMRKPMLELCDYLDGLAGRPLLRIVGVEKSGSFVEHAIALEKKLPNGTVMPLRNDYIYKYVIPGGGTEEYGFNTYYGRKFIFKSHRGDVYVCTIPIRGDWRDEANVLGQVTEPLSVISALRCSMYENALVPVALANKLVSLADYPSTRILAAFARDKVVGH
jgi:hypothetical protein